MVPTRADRWRRGLAALVTGSALALSAAAIALHVRWAGHPGVSGLHAGDLVLATLFPLAGLLVLWNRPRNAAGWVLVSAALVAVSALAHQWSSIALAEPGALPLRDAAIWFSAWTYVAYWVQPALLPVLFPDGRLPSPSWRTYLRIVLALVAVLVLVTMVKVDHDVEGLGGTNPLGQEWLWGPLPEQTVPVLQYGIGVVLWLVAAPVAVAGLLRRQRAARGLERTQLQWLLLGLTTCVVLSVVSAAAGPYSEFVFAAGFAAIPFSVAVAVLRHGLFDIEVVVHRTVAYALLTGGGVLAYLVLVALVAPYLGQGGAGPVVAAVVVALAASGRVHLQRLVDRRLFGARHDPYAVVQSVGECTAAAAAPGDALGALVAAVREALRLPFVQVLDDRGGVAAESGAPVCGTHVLPVEDAGDRLGVLVVGRRTRRERLGAGEVSALKEVARRAGGLLRAQRLTADLERSYSEVVRVREEERRRLRRDLHDGIGPSLAGVALQLEGLAARLSGEDAARAARAQARLLTTVADVRRIVDGLRPAAVEELGLPAALRALATEDGDRVLVRVEVDLPDRLPHPVEQAAYRIAGEAVTNVLRHAGAGTVRVRAALHGDRVRVEVADDGCGFVVPQQRGVGLQSMQERAQELGGRLDVVSRPGHGTRVTADLPVGAA